MFRCYRALQKGEFIICFADTAVGAGDFCAAQFLSADGLDVPLVYHADVSATAMTPLLHKRLEDIYDVTGVQPCVCYERNNGGVFELNRLATLNKNEKYYLYEQRDNEGKANGRLGWDTNTATRPKMLQDLQECINNRLIAIYDKPTVTELYQFIITKTGKPEAEAGAHDDLVMSLAGAWQLYQTEHKPQKVDAGQFLRQIPSSELFTSNGLY